MDKRIFSLTKRISFESRNESSGLILGSRSRGDIGEKVEEFYLEGSAAAFFLRMGVISAGAG